MLWFSGNQALHCDEKLPGRASFLWNSIGLRRQGSAVPDCTFVPAPAAPAAGLFSAALLLLSDKLHFKGTGRLHMADIHRKKQLISLLLILLWILFITVMGCFLECYVNPLLVADGVKLLL